MQNIKFTSFHPCFMNFRGNFNDISLKRRKRMMPKEIYRYVLCKKGIFASKKLFKGA